jgi:hypothetical protein
MNTVFMIWFGDEMPEIRKNSIKQFEKVSETNAVLITEENVDDYILDSEPLHSAYECLSWTHKSDYIRAYLMRFYGGGYSDVKMTTGSWKDSFEKLNGSDALANGYKELSKRSVPAGGGLRKNWHRLIGCSAFICKPQTKFTEDWYNKMMLTLDKNLKQLKKYPAKGCCDRFRGGPRNPITNQRRYPFRWQDLLARNFHWINLKYTDEILTTLPKPNFDSYK